MSVMSNEDSKSISQSINSIIKGTGINANDVSDGYHTFSQLYDHRITLFIALCRVLYNEKLANVWKSQFHHDGSSYDGWFIMGINISNGSQISYHLPNSRWDECSFIGSIQKAPEWDGHTSNDVLERLKQL